MLHYVNPFFFVDANVWQNPFFPSFIQTEKLMSLITSIKFLKLKCVQKIKYLLYIETNRSKNIQIESRLFQRIFAFFLSHKYLE